MQLAHPLFALTTFGSSWCCWSLTAFVFRLLSTNRDIPRWQAAGRSHSLSSPKTSRSTTKKHDDLFLGEPRRSSYDDHGNVPEPGLCGGAGIHHEAGTRISMLENDRMRRSIGEAHLG